MISSRRRRRTEGSDSVTRVEDRAGRVDGYPKNTNTLNESTNRGGPAPHPELSTELKVVLHSRTTDPTESILVPELEVDELEVAHLLTRLGNEHLESHSLPPGEQLPDRFVEFESDLAGVAPSRPSSSPKEREVTSGTRSSRVLLLGRMESQKERIAHRGEQEMVEDRQSMMSRNEVGPEKLNETGARLKIKAPSSLFSEGTHRRNDYESDPEIDAVLPMTNLKFAVSDLASGRPSTEGTGRGSGDLVRGMWPVERVELEHRRVEVRPDPNEPSGERRATTFGVLRAQSSKGGHENQSSQRYLEATAPSFPPPTYVTATNRIAQTTLSYSSASVSALLPSKCYGESVPVRSRYPAIPEDLYDPNFANVMWSRRACVSPSRSSAISTAARRNSEIHLTDLPTSAGGWREVWPGTVYPPYANPNTIRDDTFNVPVSTERVRAFREIAPPSRRNDETFQLHSVADVNKERLWCSEARGVDERSPCTKERPAEATMNRGPDLSLTALDPRIRELLRQCLREESERSKLTTSNEQTKITITPATSAARIEPEKIKPEVLADKEPPMPPKKSADRNEEAAGGGENKWSGDHTSGKGRQWIKLGTYNGKTSVEAFLKRFEICSGHNGWSDSDRLDQLMCALVEPVNQLLWECGTDPDWSWKDLVQTLRNRYGSGSQSSLYQTQLGTRRQKDGEDLNSLVHDIRRLLTLAYPGPHSSHREIIAIRAFLDALRDKALALKVREREPTSLDEALKLALRLECYGKAEEESTGGTDRRFGRVKAVHEEGHSTEIIRRVLKEELEPQRRRLEQLESLVETLRRPSTTAMADSGLVQFAPTFNRSGGQPVPRPKKDFGGSKRTFGRRAVRCYDCQGAGHFARDCPERQPVTTGLEHGQTPPESVSEPSHVRFVEGSTNAYVPVKVNGRDLLALIDTGSELSLAPASLVHTKELRRSDQILRAANGTAIRILGETTLNCELSGLSFEIPCLVTEQLTELILGLEWLERQGASWNFREQTIQIRDQTVPLQKVSSPNKRYCRRIAVAEKRQIPPLFEMNIPFYEILPNLSCREEENTMGNTTSTTCIWVAGGRHPSARSDDGLNGTSTEWSAVSNGRSVCGGRERAFRTLFRLPLRKRNT